MNVQQLKAAIKAAYGVRQPLMAWGKPGVGKTAAYYQACEELGIDCVPIRLSQLDPTDLRGLTLIDKGRTITAIPSWLPTKGKGIIFADELPQAPTSMQAAASQIVDRFCGEWKMPDGWVMHAAGNYMNNKSATNAMPMHMANRFMHVDVECDVPVWTAHALSANFDLRVVAFIKWRSALLHTFDPASKSLAFGSPRSWENVSKMLATTQDRELLSTMVKGLVGEGPVAEFMAFLNVFDKLPNMDNILMSPKTAPIPTEPAVLYAVVTTLSSLASADNIGKISSYFNRLTDEAKRPEFSILAQKEIAARDKTNKIANTRPWIEWTSKHSNMVI